MSVALGIANQALDVVGKARSLGIGQKRRNEKEDERQLKQQGKLQELAIKGSKEMTDYSAAKELQMWKDTNWSAQMEEAEKAGLSKAWLMGNGGGGQGVTGSGGMSVGEAKAADAAATQQANTAARMANAQINNINADTELKREQTDKTGEESKGIKFTNLVNENVGSKEFADKIKSELKKEFAQNRNEYRVARNITDIMNEGDSENVIIDAFGSYMEGNWKKLGEAEARKMLSTWDEFKANVDNVNQKTSESKQKENLMKVEEDILDFKADLSELGINETTVKIVELIMKAMLGGRR